MNKHLASLVLSAVLAVSCLAATAFADEPVQAAAEAAPAAEQTAEAVQPEAEAAPAAEQTAEVVPPAAEDPAVIINEDTEPEASQNFTYVALGDSITAGNGLPDFAYGPAAIGVDVEPNFKGYSPDCFVSIVADNLGLDRDHAINLGLPALMSGDLVDLLTTGAMPEMNQPAGTYYVYPQFLEYVAQADVITLQIGTNDALVPFVVSIGNATNWKSEEFANSLLVGAFRDMDEESFALFKEALAKLKLTKEERSALKYAISDGMRECCDYGYAEVTKNLPQIVNAIRALNPDVEIILLGYYNPAWMLQTWRDYFSKMNSFVKQFAQDEGLTYIKTTWTRTKNDMHPSVRGHKYLAKKVTKAIEKMPEYIAYAGD